MRSFFGFLRLFGVDLQRAALSLRGLPKFIRDYWAFKSASRAGRHDFPLARLRPVLSDHRDNAGVASGAYFHQDLYVASRIHSKDPIRHIDVGSLISGFVAHVASFRAIEVIDIRPLRTSAGNISFVRADLMDSDLVGTVGVADSVSSLHAIEHFGLGRYGDPIAVDGFQLGLVNVASMVAQGGLLYIGLPLGPQRVEFNAHRVVGAATVPEALKDEFILERFSYVDDDGEFHENVEFETDGVRTNFGCFHGCGIYELRRVQP